MIEALTLILPLLVHLNDDGHLEASGRQSTVQSVTHHPLRETRAPTLLYRLYDICFSLLEEIGLKLTYMYMYVQKNHQIRTPKLS